MRKNHTEIICILDRSGSMSFIKNDTIGGFNGFIKSQKEVDGTADVTLVLFDHEYHVPIKSKDIRSVKDLDEKTFVPRGMTALQDAIGRTINEAGERFSKMSENDRPEKVMVCILTDGEENASNEFNSDQIKYMIEHQTNKYNWEFCYIGANQDSFANSAAIGIKRGSTVNFACNAKGVNDAFDNMRAYTTSYRSN